MIEISRNFMNYRLIIVFSTCLICSILALIVNVIYGIDIVYTHLFYIPIILAGIWYPRYAIFLAAALGLIHITFDYAVIEAFKIGSLLRAVMFMVVAYVTSYLSLRLDRLLNSLRESEERYRTLIETTRDLIFTTDQKGFLTYMNPTIERTLDYTSDEWNGKTFAQIVAPECIDSVKDLFKRAIKGESIPVYVTDLIRKDGTKLSVEFNVETIYDSDGNPSGRYGIGRDITERKRVEGALEEERRRLQQALDEVRTLRGIVPICANCKKIRDDKGFWNQVEKYISDHTEARFSHGICPDCAKELYPELYKKRGQ
jgi:PAS domain S-box-containing protein